MLAVRTIHSVPSCWDWRVLIGNQYTVGRWISFKMTAQMGELDGGGTSTSTQRSRCSFLFADNFVNSSFPQSASSSQWMMFVIHTRTTLSIVGMNVARVELLAFRSV